MDEEPEIFLCHQCGKLFHKLSTLESHTRWKHSEKTTEFMCDQCGRTFQKKYNLLKHLQTGMHYMAETVKCAVENCDFRSQNRRIMGCHYQKYHGVSLKENTVYFNTSKDFFSWKSDFENQTRARFVKMSSSRVRKNGCVKSTYFCHRDGNFVPKGKNIRHLKVKGSNKINAHCPAKIDVEIGEKIVTASYIDLHLGHDLDITRLSLDRDERALIARKLAMKVPFEEILDELNAAARSSDNELKRLNLLTRKDLWNIVETFKINPKNVVYSKSRLRRKVKVNQPKKGPPKSRQVDLETSSPKSEVVVEEQRVYNLAEREEGEIITINDENYVMCPVFIKSENDEYIQKYALIPEENEIDEDSCLIINSQGEIETISSDQVMYTVENNEEEIYEATFVDNESELGTVNGNTVIAVEDLDIKSEIAMIDEESGEVIENVLMDEIVYIDGKPYRIKRSDQQYEDSSEGPDEKKIFIQSDECSSSSVTNVEASSMEIELIKEEIDDEKVLVMSDEGTESNQQIKEDFSEVIPTEVTVADFDEPIPTEVTVAGLDESEMTYDIVISSKEGQSEASSKNCDLSNFSQIECPEIPDNSEKEDCTDIQTMTQSKH